MLRGLRALSVLLRRAEEGEFSILVDESPRTEELRNDRVRIGMWTALLLLTTWLTVTLRGAAISDWLTWPMIGAVGIAFCLWRLVVALRRLS
jgi:hypothetical protein